MGMANAGESVTQRFSYSFAEPVITDSDAGVLVEVEGCELYGPPGSPLLPVRGVTLKGRRGYRVAAVEVLPGDSVELVLERGVVYAMDAVRLAAMGEAHHLTKRNEDVYGRDTPYPVYGVDEGSRWRRDRRGGIDEVAVSLYPVRLIPAINRLLYYGEITVEVTWQRDEVREADGRGRGRERVVRHDGLQGRESVAAGVLEEGRYDHVIVTVTNFVSTKAPWNLAALVASRSSSGLASKIVTTEWIYSNYHGRDDAERIRSFVQDAYANWHTRYLLLVGRTDLVPTRQLYVRFSDNQANIGADGIYYGCLDGDYDDDGNGIFGELKDGLNGGDVDLVAEVYVGRFPVRTVTELERMVRKTLTYESLPAAKLQKVGYLGEHLGFGGDSEYSDLALADIRYGSEASGFATLGIENENNGTNFSSAVVLNDTPSYTWDKAHMFSLLNQDFHVFNHLGHGARQWCLKINVSTSADEQRILGLTNSVPNFTYSQACDSGWYDTSVRCFAEHYVTAPQAAFAAIMNSRSGWGYLGNHDGPSQRFQRTFWDTIFSGEAHTLGQANALAKERLRHLVDPVAGNVFRWCYYTINLFGDPATPFAAVLLHHPPEFEHEGLENSYLTDSPYAVEVRLGPSGLIDAKTPMMVWQSDVEPGMVNTNILTLVSPGWYVSEIAPQPMGAKVGYMLGAGTVAGVWGEWPGEGWHEFSITPPVTLEVGAEPSEWGVVEPTYGSHTIASGVVVRASAPQRVVESAALSRALTGAVLNGEIMTPDETGEVKFTLDTASELRWQWCNEHSLQYTSNVPSILQQVIWYTTNSVVTLETAPVNRLYRNKRMVFCGWYLDGERQPAAPAVIINPVTEIDMSVSHIAYAHYLPIDQDSDGNGIPDWWEYYYFGESGLDPASDFDNDGFTLAEEYADRTDPLDESSVPAAPLIDHTPLVSVQSAPPPYLIEAVITDSYLVETAILLWRHNGAEWHTNALELVEGDVAQYSTTINVSSMPGDIIEYKLIASDPAGYVAEHGPHTVTMIYPLAYLTPEDGLTVAVLGGGNGDSELILTNSGNAALVWQLSMGEVERVAVEPSLWVTNAFEQPWSITTNRFYSAPYAFHGRAVSNGKSSGPPVYAGLVSAPYELGSGATLFFKYWIAGEIDTRQEGWAFDAGIVEVSTNDGASFVQLDGSYTHLLAGWKYSPWDDGTPCLSGDGSEGWREAHFPLNMFAGQRVCFRFIYGGDNNTDGEGWYIDDIRVGPIADLQWPAWLVCGASAGAVIAERGVVIPTYLIGDAMSGREGLASLHLVSNDPVRPNIYSDVEFKIRDLPRLDFLTACQSSTNGEGVVTITAVVSERDGETLTVEAEFSLDGGGSWQAVTPADAHTLIGEPLLTTNSNAVNGIATQNDIGEIVTNRLELGWETRESTPPLPLLVSGAVVRARALSPYFVSPYIETAPFMIDNEAPSAPGAVEISSHTTGVWSRVGVLAATWSAASDGMGVGEISYS